jgi:hypothetical protein
MTDYLIAVEAQTFSAALFETDYLSTIRDASLYLGMIAKLISVSARLLPVTLGAS